MDMLIKLYDLDDDWHFMAEKFPLDGQDDLDRYSAWLDELPAKQRTAIKVGFEGSINLATAAALDEVFESRAELFASLRRRARTTDLAIVPDELDHDSVSLSGYAKRTYDDLLEQSMGGVESREIHFADGITLIEGPNEIGKTTIVTQ